MKEITGCHRDIQIILQEAIKYYDFSVISGKRSAEEQNEAWAKGRKLKDNGDPRKRTDWEVLNDKDIVTTKDGYEKKSNHQGEPKSKAVDIVPYPAMWSSDSEFFVLSGVIKSTQERLLVEGKIKYTMDWGQDMWDWDKPHWQIRS